MHEQRNTKQKNDDKTPEGAVPAYLLDREGQSRAKVLSNMIKQKRKEKAVSIASDAAAFFYMSFATSQTVQKIRWNLCSIDV